MNKIIELRNNEREAHNAVGEVSRKLNRLRMNGKAIDIEDAIEEKEDLTAEWLAARSELEHQVTTRGKLTAHSDITEGRYITGGVRNMIHQQRDGMLDRGCTGWDVRFLGDMAHHKTLLSDKQADNLARILGV